MYKLTDQEHMFTNSEKKNFGNALLYAEKVLRNTSIEIIERAVAYRHAFNAAAMLGLKDKALNYLKKLSCALAELPKDNKELFLGEATVTARGYDGSELPSYEAPPSRSSVPSKTSGLNLATLAQLSNHCEQTAADGYILLHRGEIVLERYSPISKNPMSAMSSTKSIAALLVGMLFDDGKIDSLSDPLCKYISSYNRGFCSQVTIEHVLTMTTGLDRIVNGHSIGYQNDKSNYALRLEPSTEPGSKWAYSNEAVQLLEPLLSKVAGQPIEEYAQQRLFKPLEFKQTYLRTDGAGSAMLYADMRTTLREFAQLGHLVATNGCHRGRQLISPEWIKEMTTPKEKAWGVVPFGYLWYLPKETVQATYGYLCNNLYILPQQEIVFGRCQRQHYLHQSEPFNEELVLSLLHSVLDS